MSDLVGDIQKHIRLRRQKFFNDISQLPSEIATNEGNGYVYTPDDDLYLRHTDYISKLTGSLYIADDIVNSGLVTKFTFDILRNSTSIINTANNTTANDDTQDATLNSSILSGGPDGDYLNCPGTTTDGGAFHTNAPNIISDFSVSLWINPLAIHQLDGESTSGTAGMSGQKYILEPYNESIATVSHIGISAGTNGVSVYEHSDSYMPCVLSWSGTVSGWTHVVMNYTAKQPHLYIDNTFVQSGLNSPRAEVRFKPRYIGYHPYGGFEGYTDNIRIYNRTLSVSEIDTLYNNGVMT